MRAARVALLAATAALAPLATASTQEASKVEPGTILEISAVGVPDFRYKVPVDAAGTASFPLLDPIRVGGLTLAEIQAKVRAQLPGKVFRQRGPAGTETYVSFNADEILVSVAEYRPIYITGNVAKPGEVTFRPGLDVRQAIALAGGFDLVQARLSNPFMEAADIEAEYTGNWAEFVKERARLLALQAALEGDPDPDIRKALRAPLPEALLDRIASNERSRLATRAEDNRKEIAHLRGLIGNTQIQIDTLVEEQMRQQESLKQQGQDLERIKNLNERGVVAINRLGEEQARLAIASQRILAVTAQLADARRQHGEAQRHLQAAVDQRRLQLLADIQETTVKLEVLRARIGGLDQKMAYTRASKFQLARGLGTVADIIVYRKGDQGVVQIKANEDESLQAGDTVEVFLQTTATPSSILFLGSVTGLSD
jgi:polysaccharide export outer membrane protein